MKNCLKRLFNVYLNLPLTPLNSLSSGTAAGYTYAARFSFLQVYIRRFLLCPLFWSDLTLLSFSCTSHIWLETHRVWSRRRRRRRKCGVLCSNWPTAPPPGLSRQLQAAFPQNEPSCWSVHQSARTLWSRWSVLLNDLGHFLVAAAAVKRRAGFINGTSRGSRPAPRSAQTASKMTANSRYKSRAPRSGKRLQVGNSCFVASLH